MINAIYLTSSSEDDIRIQLNNTKKNYVIEDILEVKHSVYSDIEYSLKIDGDNIANIIVYLNGEVVKTAYAYSKIFFTEDYRYIFKDLIGLAQFDFLFQMVDGSTEWRYSEYFSVMIRSTDTNDTIDKMLKYVYKNQEDILHRTGSVAGVVERGKKVYDDFWSQIVLFEDIANVYESSYGYFKANSRYKLEKTEVLDRIEKLQYMDSKTLNYISQHPEFLRRETSGIRFGKQSFMPIKTLMTQNSITYDIDENRVVVGFLEKMHNEVVELAKIIQKYIDYIDIPIEVQAGYIASAQLLYVNARDTFYSFLVKVNEIEQKYKKLLNSYRGIYKFKNDIKFDKSFKPSAIFMRVPQYNRVYTCINRWLSKQAYDLVNEKIMMNFFDAPAIYEAYVLIKLIHQIKKLGYELYEAKNVNYPMSNGSRYRHQDYNNTYHFRSEHSEITLYYEPVIYAFDNTDFNGLALYRNNNVSWNQESAEEQTGNYYVPDYVLKINQDNKERYVICDAKMTRYSRVRFEHAPALAYKYLTSISTTSEDAELKGLYLAYCLNGDHYETESFYNKQLNGVTISPAIELMPLSENVPESDQDKNLNVLLEFLIKV